jgi:hypothetical protein
MAELVDAHGSGPCALGCGGSSPLLGTNDRCKQNQIDLTNRITVFSIAQMAELVDAHGSGPCALGCGGSSPLLGTIYDIA